MIPIAVGLARMYRGMHYPSDVLAGAALSASWLALSARAVRLSAQRVEIECDRPQPVERDADPAAPTRRFAVEVIPDALTLCVPAQKHPSRRTT